MAELTSLEAGEFENVRWFATGVLTGMLALRLHGAAGIVSSYFHTTSKRLAKRVWEALGGTIRHIRQTGEVRYDHPYFPNPLRANDRRHAPPAKLISRINQLRRELGGVFDERTVPATSKERWVAGGTPVICQREGGVRSWSLHNLERQMTEIVFLALANGQSVMGVIEQSSAQLPLSIHYPLMVQVDDAGEARFFPILAREYMKDAGGKPYIDLGVEWVYRVPPSQIFLNAYQDATKRFY